MSLELTQSRMPRWLIGGALFLAAACTLIWQFPSRWLQHAVSSNTQCKTLLENPTGTIWHGSTAIGFSEPSLDGKSCRPALAVTERIHWSTDCRISQMACHVRIETPALHKPLVVTLSPGLIKIDSNEARMPAEILEVIGAPWTLLHPRADLQLRWNEITLGHGIDSGSLRASLNDLTSPISQIKPLGSYDIQASLNATGLSYKLTTSKGPLLLTAEGSLGQTVSGHGEATATPEMQEALTGLLNLIGKRQGNVYRLSF